MESKKISQKEKIEIYTRVKEELGENELDEFAKLPKTTNIKKSVSQNSDLFNPQMLSKDIKSMLL